GLVLSLVLGGSTCPRVLGHGIRRIPEDADDLTDRNGLTLGGRLLDEVAVLVGLVLHDGFVGLDLDQAVSGGVLVADVLHPGADDPLLHGVGEARHVDLAHWYSLPTPFADGTQGLLDGSADRFDRR